MAGISKRVSGSWVSGVNGIMKTATDTITTLPANIYPNATTATVGLKGNMQQSGTPSPTTPIQPQECGDMTGNLFNPYTVVDGYYVSDTNGELKPASNNVSSDYIEVEDNTDYYITMIPSGNWGAWYDENKTFISGIIGYNIRKTPANAKYVRLTVSRNNNPYYATNFMITKSSVSIPFEPFGIKIPISSANTTTNVYLGEVQTTRNIRKLVLTGQENWNRDGTSSDITRYCIGLNDAYKSSGTYNTQFYISHYKIVAGGYTDNTCFLYNSNVALLYVCVDINTYPLPDDFKTYLAQQYANGTPVCVWYVLTEPTTGIVNEPLRKIGEYADTLSNVSIPVTAGGDTISVDTTVQPSEITVNYKGWHPAIVHERTNGAWT